MSAQQEFSEGSSSKANEHGTSGVRLPVTVPAVTADATTALGPARKPELVSEGRWPAPVGRVTESGPEIPARGAESATKTKSGAAEAGSRQARRKGWRRASRAAGAGETTATETKSRTAEAGSGQAQRKGPEIVPRAVGAGETKVAGQAAVASAVPPDAGHGEGDQLPSGRLRKPMLAAAGIGGAVLVSIPFLMAGMGADHGKQHKAGFPFNSPAGTVLRENAGLPPAGAFSSASPSPSASASHSAAARPSGTPSKGTRAVPKAVVGRSVNAALHFQGVKHVLLKNVATGMCADLPLYGEGVPRGPVNQSWCAPGTGDNQDWLLQLAQPGIGPHGANLFVVRNQKDDRCLDLGYWGANPAGTPVEESTCNLTTGDNMLWWLEDKGNHQYWIRHYASHGLCLSVTGSPGTKADTQLDIDDCKTNKDDRWSWLQD